MHSFATQINVRNKCTFRLFLTYGHKQQLRTYGMQELNHICMAGLLSYPNKVDRCRDCTANRVLWHICIVRTFLPFAFAYTTCTCPDRIFSYTKFAICLISLLWFRSQLLQAIFIIMIIRRDSELFFLFFNCILLEGKCTVQTKKRLN